MLCDVLDGESAAVKFWGWNQSLSASLKAPKKVNRAWTPKDANQTGSNPKIARSWWWRPPAKLENVFLTKRTHLGRRSLASGMALRRIATAKAKLSRPKTRFCSIRTSANRAFGDLACLKFP